MLNAWFKHIPFGLYRNISEASLKQNRTNSLDIIVVLYQQIPIMQALYVWICLQEKVDYKKRNLVLKPGTFKLKRYSDLSMNTANTYLENIQIKKDMCVKQTKTLCLHDDVVHLRIFTTSY